MKINKKIIQNGCGAKIEVIGFEPTSTVDSHFMFYPKVNIRVRLFSDEEEFSNYSLNFTINNYVIPDKYNDYPWDEKTPEDSWKVLVQKLWDNIENLHVLNAFSSLRDVIDAAEYDYEVIYAEAEEFDGDWLESFWRNSLHKNVVHNFKILKCECDVLINKIEDYITDFEVVNNK